MAYDNFFKRSIAIADYILEDGGHSTKEAAKEFRVSVEIINRSIRTLGACAFYGHEPNEKELKEKYLNVKRTLKEIASHNSSTSRKSN